MNGSMAARRTVFVSALALLVAPVGMHGATGQTITVAAQPPELLFVQSAKAVDYKDGVLTLRDAAPTTIFFSDRPKRVAGHVGNDMFMKLWSEGKNSFKTDPPNATLSVFNQGGRPTQVVMVLSNPRVDGKDIRYDAKPLQGDVPAQGKESTLFIDGANAPCWSGDDFSGEPCWAQQAFDPH